MQEATPSDVVQGSALGVLLQLLLAAPFLLTSWPAYLSRAFDFSRSDTDVPHALHPGHLTSPLPYPCQVSPDQTAEARVTTMNSPAAHHLSLCMSGREYRTGRAGSSCSDGLSI